MTPTDEILTLLKVEEFTRDHPNLKSIHDLVMLQLQDINDEASEDLEERRKADKEEAAAKVAEAEAERQRIAAENAPKLVSQSSAASIGAVNGTVERRA